MKSGNYTILWMLYGFVLITTTISILEAAVYAYMHYGLTNRYMIMRFSYYIPCFAFVSYSLTSAAIILFVKRKIRKNISHRISLFLVIICMLLSIGLQYYTEKISDWHLTTLFDDLSKSDYMSSMDFGRLFEVVELTTMTMRWVFILILILFFHYKLKAINKGK